MSGIQPTLARAALHEANASAARAGVLSSSYEGDDDSPTVAQRRRRTGLADPLGFASLVVNDEGVLVWHLGEVAGVGAGRRRQRRAVPLPAQGETVEIYHFDRLEPNEVNALLLKHDRELNDHAGLWRLGLKNAGKATQSVERVARVESLSGRKKRLLFVHGTFSKSESFFIGMESAPQGREAIKKLFDRYDEVLAFDHPTLSVSPVMNAFDLARMLVGIDGPMDLIAHSRGGLVVRWTLEGFGLSGGPYRAVLVGCPLAGTSLASPPHLKNALSAMSNFGAALKAAGTAAAVYLPFLTVPLVLLRVASSVLTVTAKTPIVDAAISMIPGLQGQSRISDHPELVRLRAVKLASPPRYFVVKSNFETEDTGWKFWRWFRKDKLLDTGADLVFPAENDLVVDTSSMSDIPGASLLGDDVHDFGTSATVHHTNYFSQPETLAFILDRLS